MKIQISVGVLLTILVIVGIKLTNTGMEIQGISVGPIILASTIAYLIFSFGIVRVEQVAMLTLFGDPIKNLEEGLYFAPAGIMSVRKEAGTVFQDELPADPEKIFRGDGNPPEGMFPPIRVKFGQPNPADTTLADDPYNVAMVAEVVPVTSWHITDAITFFKMMGSVANCRKIMADKATEVFGDNFAKVTPAKAMLGMTKTSKKLEKKLTTETSGWGIEITDAYVKPIIFSHPLNTAVVAVSVAREEAKAKVLTANGNAKAVEIAAEAEKKRQLTTGLARADAHGNITELLPDANTRVRTEAIKKLAETKGTVVFGGIDTMLGVNQKGKQE